MRSAIDLTNPNVFHHDKSNFGDLFSIKISRASYTIFFGNSAFDLESRTKSILSDTVGDFSGGHLYRMNQNHSCEIQDVSKFQNQKQTEESRNAICDAMVTNCSQHMLSVRTADCIPAVLIGASTMAAIHAGWRGVHDGIGTRTFRHLLQCGESPQNIVAILGPHIRKESFEVGPDVAEMFFEIAQKLQLDINSISTPLTKVDGSERHCIDLSRIFIKQLESLGLPTNNIFDIKIDTFKDSRYCSFRRDRTSARNITLAHRNVPKD